MRQKCSCVLFAGASRGMRHITVWKSARTSLDKIKLVGESEALSKSLRRSQKRYLSCCTTSHIFSKFGWRIAKQQSCYTARKWRQLLWRLRTQQCVRGVYDVVHKAWRTLLFTLTLSSWAEGKCANKWSLEIILRLNINSLKYMIKNKLNCLFCSYIFKNIWAANFRREEFWFFFKSIFQYLKICCIIINYILEHWRNCCFQFKFDC